MAGGSLARLEASTAGSGKLQLANVEESPWSRVVLGRMRLATGGVANYGRSDA